MAIRSIPDIRVTDPNTREVLEAMKEIIEVLLGRRGADAGNRVVKYGSLNVNTVDISDGVTGITAGAGADTIDLASLNAALAIQAAEINYMAAILNDLRSRFIP